MMMEDILHGLGCGLRGLSRIDDESAGARAYHPEREPRVRLVDGVAMPEAGINAAIAGRFGVPVVFISGDNVAVDETRRLLGDVEGAVVKQAISFHSASTMTPKAAQQLVREHVKAAVQRRTSFKPYVVRPPVTLDVIFKNYRPAEMLAFLPIVHGTTSHGLRFIGQDMIEVSKFLEFIGTWLSPVWRPDALSCQSVVRPLAAESPLPARFPRRPAHAGRSVSQSSENATWTGSPTRTRGSDS